MTSFTAISATDLTPPKVFPNTNPERVLDDLKAIMVGINPDYAAALSLDSSELSIAFQAIAYRIANAEQDINEGVLAQLLAFAKGDNLEWQGQIRGVARKVIAEATDDAPAVYEAEADYQSRIQLAPEGYTTAGSKGAYIFHALAADPLVKGADARDNGSGQVVIPVLSHEGQGEADADLLNTVRAALNGEFVRPTNDRPIVQSAGILTYDIDATVYFYGGPDRALAFSDVARRVAEFTANRHRLGDDVPLSGLYAALHIPEVVSRVDLRAPLATIPVAWNEAAYCVNINLVDGGVDG